MRARMHVGLLAALFVSWGVSAAHAATITIVNADGAGEGFNDPTAVSPVGGNSGTTRGAQRLFVFQTAAAIWGGILPSNVTIRVNSKFDPMTCTPTSAALGGAAAATVASDFSGSEFAATWYPIALANRLAGVDLAPAANDINATFNVTLDGGTCLGGLTWYYGIDGNETANTVELLPVILHEMGHGLGFAQFASLTSGAPFSGQTDVFQRFLFDHTLAKTWNAMTDGERVQSAVNTGNVVWNGPAVGLTAPSFLAPPRLEVAVASPPGIAGQKIFGAATFGPPATAQLVSGAVVLADDGVAPNSDGCSALVNGAALLGKIALVDRGTCGFVQKAQAAEAAGAIAVVIANNAAGAPPAMGGVDPGLTIPTVSITQADGNAIKAALGGGVTMSIGPNPSFLAGADDQGRPLMYAPNPIEQGSSISHWDVTATPNTLMEPFLNDDLSSGVDLTRFVFEDIGWFQPRTTAVEDVASSVRLVGNWPNPFASSTTIRIELARRGPVEVRVFDALGRTVRTLASGELDAGAHGLTWDGRDDAGRRVAPGVYFYRLAAEGSFAVRRAVVLAGAGSP